MATIQENLDLLQNTKANIKQAIINKGVNVADSDAFSTYPSKISQIQTGGNINDITQKYSNLCYYTGNTLPTDLIGWGNLTNGTYKCASSNLSTFNKELPSLTSGYYMFYNCLNLTSWNVDLPSLISAQYMFSGCTSLQSFTSDLSQLEDSSYMFNDCTNLTSWNNNIPNLNNGDSMFYNCRNLTTFTSNLSSLTNGNQMFGYTKINSWNIDLPNLNNGSNMFSYTHLTNWNTPLPKLTDAQYMFSRCYDLVTYNVTDEVIENSTYMFMFDDALTAFTGNLSNLTNPSNMFNGCDILENITITGTLNCNNFDLSPCPNLTVDSLMSVINALVDLTGQFSKRLTLGSTNLAKLSEEQKAIATNKNWILQ